MEFTSAAQLHADFLAGRASPVEVMDRIFQRIGTLRDLGAYWTLNEDARKAAADAERALHEGKPIGPLHGVPFSVKDLIATAGLRTTRGSAMFADWVPQANAPVVERALAAGAILVGKTSTSELGWKAITDAPLFGVTRNPWNPAFTPGGSSGGAATAVAAGLGALAIATDAAGSARLPAAFCGVFGMKPSFGRIPIHPAPAAESLVHVGLVTRTVRDCALLLSVVAGPDERDRNSLPADNAGDSSSGGLRAAWCPRFAGLAVEPAVLAQCAAAVAQYQRAGLHVDEIEVELPDISAAFRTLFHGTFGAPLADALPKWRSRMDPGLVEMVEAGRRLSAYELTKANMARAAFCDALGKIFDKYELLLLPVAGSAAVPLEAVAQANIDGVPSAFPQWLSFLYPFNLSGQPAASIPCGWTDDGLPVGVQVVARRFQDRLLLNAAAQFESVLPWANRTPPI
jgi:aspartyl-tRNA(Asn)/glutamyl-tRNA(Gln) amidotransferase subunit A